MKEVAKLQIKDRTELFQATAISKECINKTEERHRQSIDEEKIKK